MTIRAKQSTSRALLLIPLPLALLCAFYAPRLLSLTETTPTTTTHPTEPASLPRQYTGSLPSRGVISDLLHLQNLSHAAFHNDNMKPYLAELVSRHHAHPKSAVIIGLAYGSEAKKLRDYNVHAIEPMPHFIKNFRRLNLSHVTLHPFAAANEDGTLEVTYNGVTLEVNKTRGDSVLPKGMAPVVVSADTQGSEYDALLGLGEVMTRAGSVWVELGCRDSTEEMLRWLDERFVLFDFVPWGKSPGVDGAFDKEQFATGERPADIGKWVNWFCERKKEFQWLQTDVVGVRRDIAAGVWQGLADIGEKCCQEGCALKEIMDA